MRHVRCAQPDPLEDLVRVARSEQDPANARRPAPIDGNVRHPRADAQAALGLDDDVADRRDRGLVGGAS